jgi:hypothetical protein
VLGHPPPTPTGPTHAQYERIFAIAWPMSARPCGGGVLTTSRLSHAPVACDGLFGTIVNCFELQGLWKATRMQPCPAGGSSASLRISSHPLPGGAAASIRQLILPGGVRVCCPDPSTARRMLRCAVTTTQLLLQSRLQHPFSYFAELAFVADSLIFEVHFYSHRSVHAQVLRRSDEGIGRRTCAVDEVSVLQQPVRQISGIV